MAAVRSFSWKQAAAVAVGAYLRACVGVADGRTDGRTDGFHLSSAGGTRGNFATAVSERVLFECPSKNRTIRDQTFFCRQNAFANICTIGGRLTQARA